MNQATATAMKFEVFLRGGILRCLSDTEILKLGDIDAESERGKVALEYLSMVRTSDAQLQQITKQIEGYIAVSQDAFRFGCVASAGIGDKA